MSPAAAQPASAPPSRNGQAAEANVNRDQRAEDTRRALREVLEQYPPALGRILKLDPTLMSNQAFMAPYPALNALLQTHPEIGRDTGYFLEDVWIRYEGTPATPEQEARRRAIDLWERVLTGLMILSIFGTLVFTLTWLVRYFVSHRRWLRAVALQSEMHEKVMERLGSADDVRAYVQSSAGQALVLPIGAVEPAGRNVAAPFARILWSIQTALVLACGGVGLLVIRQYVLDEIAQMMLVLGVLALSLGVGFGLAAVASYGLSASLGLIEASREATRPRA